MIHLLLCIILFPVALFALGLTVYMILSAVFGILAIMFKGSSK